MILRLWCAIFLICASTVYATPCSTVGAVLDLKQMVSELFKNKVDYQRLGLPDLAEALNREIEAELSALGPLQKELLRQRLKPIMIDDVLEFFANNELGKIKGRSNQVHLYQVALDHPAGVIIARHELKHLVRINTRPLRAAITRIFRRHHFMKTEEIEAWGAEYDFVQKNIPAALIPTLRQKLNVTPLKEIYRFGLANGYLAPTGENSYGIDEAKFVDFFLVNYESSGDMFVDTLTLMQVMPQKLLSAFAETEGGRRGLEKIAMRYLDRYLLNNVENVHTKTRSQYIEDALKKYSLGTDFWDYITFKGKPGAAAIPVYAIFHYVLSLLKA